MPFITTGQMTEEQAQAIDKALEDHNINVPDGGQFGGFDWLCEWIEVELRWYVICKDDRPQSRADALGDIERLRYALNGTGPSARGILSEAAHATKAQELFHHTGLDVLSARVEEIAKTGKGAFGDIPDELGYWLSDNPGMCALSSLAWSLLSEACEIALCVDPPLSMWSNGKTIVEEYTADTKGGRPKGEAKQQLVRKLAATFKDATGRRATDTAAGPFDDFLTACFAVIEPPNQKGTSNRKLIHKALEHVPKPRRKN